MSNLRRDIDYLADIVEAMERIVLYMESISYEQFMNDTKTQDAVLRNLEVIGEAVKGLSTRLRKTYPHIPWKQMAGMRDKIIHHYFGINYDIVWKVAKEDISRLLPEIQGIKQREA